MAVPRDGRERRGPAHPNTHVHTHMPLTAESQLCWSRPHVSGLVARQGPPACGCLLQTHRGGGGHSTEFLSLSRRLPPQSTPSPPRTPPPRLRQPLPVRRVALACATFIRE